MTRELRQIPLIEAIRRGGITVTMSVGQWDGFLAAAYDEGYILLELDDEERPLRAYKKASCSEARQEAAWSN